MELVYLWVEKYKNIKKQGFNFSPRFDCNYNKDAKELTINKKEDYISIFPDNINITAIIGENGSGKTTIFEIISKIFLNEIFEKEIILVIDFNGVKLANKEINSNIGKVQPIDGLKNLTFFNGIYYSPNFTNSSINDIIEEFSSPLKFKYKKDSFDTHDNGLTTRNNIKNQSLLSLYLNASRIIENHPTDSAYKKKDAFTIKDNIQNINLAKTIIMLNFMNLFGKDYLKFNRQNDYVEISIYQNKNTNTLSERDFIKKLEVLFQLETNFTSDEEKLKYEKALNKKAYIEKLNQFISFCKEHFPSNISSYETFELNIDKSLELINYYISLYIYNRNLEFNILNFKYKDLSSGEENLLLMYALLELGIEPFLVNKNGPNYNITVMLDEIENNIHAKKQKELISKTLEFFQIIKKEWETRKDDIKLSFNLIFASHSPFLISDIPKENIIFLNKYNKNDNEVKKQIQQIDNSKNVSNSVKIEKTFGANIHTLLSHGFFMENGLMGQFAKEKIEEIKKFYELVKILKNKQFNRLKKLYLKRKKKFKHIQSIIGEPFLQTIIKNYLDELEIIFNGKKQFLQNEIKKLQELESSL